MKKSFAAGLASLAFGIAMGLSPALRSYPVLGHGGTTTEPGPDPGKMVAIRIELGDRLMAAFGKTRPLTQRDLCAATNLAQRLGHDEYFERYDKDLFYASLKPDVAANVASDIDQKQRLDSLVILLACDRGQQIPQEHMQPLDYVMLINGYSALGQADLRP